MKKLIFSLAVILIITSLCDAKLYGEGSYGESNYGGSGLISEYCGDGTCNNGETCSSCASDCGACPVTPSPGGGSSGGASCTYNWQCTSWFPAICPESEMQERICVNRGTCGGINGMPNQTQTCEYLGHSEPLFDIYLSLEDKYKEICAGSKIKSNIKLENYAKVELLDAFMTYWIVDGNNKLIAELKDTRAVEKETSFNIEMKIPESSFEGTYKLYAQINYNGNKTAMAGETFEILSQDECAILSSKYFNWNYLIYSGIAVLIAGIGYILLRTFKKINKKQGVHKNYRSKIKENLRKIKGKHFLMFILSISLITMFFITGNKLTGFVVGSASAVSNNWNIFGFVLIVGIFGLISFVYRKKIIEVLQNRGKKYPANRLIGLINKKAYTESGDYLGKVEDIFLKENRIDCLKIRFDKKHKVRGVVISYKHVKSVGKIVIIQCGILEQITH